MLSYYVTLGMLTIHDKMKEEKIEKKKLVRTSLERDTLLEEDRNQRDNQLRTIHHVNRIKTEL